MSITRGMVVTILYRNAGSPAVGSAGNPFSDVPAGMWFTNAVIWAAANGIVTGYGNGKFGPDDSITREQMAAILMRYAEFAGKEIAAVRSLVEFADDAQIEEYAHDAVYTLYRGGIIEGKENGIFDPKGYATRAEIAALIKRFIEAL